MVSVDLGAVAENLFESELFGHVKGAFTDARGDRIGRMQAADGGTLFLDEIGNLPLHLQPKLLTALEQRQVAPVGANKPVPIDIRVIAATNCPPEQLSDEGRFRQDLLFRLNTVEIELPPLARAARGHPRCSPTISSPSMPGNTASRRGRCRRRRRRARAPMTGPATSARCATPASARSSSPTATPSPVADFSLSRGLAPPRTAPAPAPAARRAHDLNLDRAEKQLVEEALKKHGYNISLAAAELGLTRASLYRRMEKHGL